MIRVGAEESLRIGRPGEDFEPLLLERHEVPRPDPSRPLDVGQLELLAHPRLTKAAADLEHVRLLTAVTYSVARDAPVRQGLAFADVRDLRVSEADDVVGREANRFLV